MKTIAQKLNIKEFPFEIKDSKGNQIYSEYSNGSWYKLEYDSNNNEIYSENSIGWIDDNRPKSIPEYTIEQLQQMIGKEFKIIK